MDGMRVGKGSAPQNMSAELGAQDRAQQIRALGGGRAVWSPGPRPGVITRKATLEEMEAAAQLMARRRQERERTGKSEVQIATEFVARQARTDWKQHWKQGESGQRVAN